MESRSRYEPPSGDWRVRPNRPFDHRLFHERDATGPPPGYESFIKAEESNPALELIPTDALMEVGRVLWFATSKYGPELWRQDPTTIKARIGSAIRHLYKANKGEDLDPQTGCYHLAHSIVQSLFALEYQLHPEMFPDADNRFKTAPPISTSEVQQDDSRSQWLPDPESSLLE